MKPFIKWAGGKGQFLEVLTPTIPKYNRYIEPFVGGGAMLFHLQPKNFIANDINKELITTYKVFQESNEKQLYKYLNIHEKNNSKDYFLKLRRENPEQLNPEQVAARMIYLNKTCFNGLYRVNSKGEFNVPYGDREGIKIYDRNNLKSLQSYISNSKGKFFSEDYKDIISKAKEGDFIFVDPPYDGDDVFTSYTKDGFSKQDQKDLAKLLNSLTSKGVKWILCNYDTDLVKELYKGNNKMSLSAKRYISASGENRKNSYKEVFYFNYEIDEMEKKVAVHEYYSTIASTNKTLSYYVDWEKVEINVATHKLNLSQLNSLTRCKNKNDVNKMVKSIFDNNRGDAFESLEILIAKRDNDRLYLDPDTFETMEYSFKDDKSVIKFIKETNLYDLLFKVNNLEDYVFGVEVGLDTNARKNRGGSIMEYTIREILKKNNIKFEEQVNSSNLGLPLKKTKRIDFVFVLGGIQYLIESSFYNSGGSKISEVCNSYADLNKKLNKKQKLIWVADGSGMRTIKNLIYEQWDNLEIMSIKQFEDLLVYK